MGKEKKIFGLKLMFFAEEHKAVEEILKMRNAMAEQVGNCLSDVCVALNIQPVIASHGDRLERVSPVMTNGCKLNGNEQMRMFYAEVRTENTQKEKMWRELCRQQYPHVKAYMLGGCSDGRNINKTLYEPDPVQKADKTEDAEA